MSSNQELDKDSIALSSEELKPTKVDWKLFNADAQEAFNTISDAIWIQTGSMGNVTPEVTFLKDSGSRQVYQTGAMKESQDQEGKGDFSLIPPMVIKKYAEVLRVGAKKYDRFNWMRGLPLSRLLDSAQRHLNQFQEGLIDEQHLIQCAWNILALSTTMDLIERGLLPEELNDLPSYGVGPNYRKPGKGCEIRFKGQE